MAKISGRNSNIEILSNEDSYSGLNNLDRKNTEDSGPQKTNKYEHIRQKQAESLKHVPY